LVGVSDMKKATNFIIAVVMFVSSFSTLYVCVNITSLTKELNNYMQGAPYAPSIKVGDMGFYSHVIMEQYKGTKGINQLNNLIYHLSWEKTTLPSTPATISIPLLTDAEVASISKLKGIKCAFNFDETDLIRTWMVAALSGITRELVYPLTPQYLRALHPPLKEGRYFKEGDPLNVLLIDEDYAAKIVNGSDVLGRKVTIYTSTGPQQFTIIGVLARISSSYLGSSSLPSSVVVPYRPGRESSYVRGDGKVIPRPPQPQLWIIPQEGHEQQLLSGIRKILGKEKYEAVVSSSTWEFENSFGVQVRRERIKDLAASSALTLLIGMLTIGGLIYIDISSQKRELGIRRAVGATTSQIAWEYATHLLCLLGLSFLVAALVLTLFLPLFTRYNGLGSYINPYQSPAEILPLLLSGSAVLYAFGFLAVVVVGVVLVLVRQGLRGTPSHLLLSFEGGRENRTRLITLAVVITVSVTAAFTSLSLMATTRRASQDLVRDIPQQSFWMNPEESRTPYAGRPAKYTMDDYRALREALLGKALVGCRQVVPIMSSILLPSGGTMDLRASEATEDFPAIYDMAVGSGRFLTDADSGMCMLGAAVASSMDLKIGDTFMGNEIIGILQVHSSLIDRTVYVPAADPLMGTNPENVLLVVKPVEGANRAEVAKTVLDLLQERHPGYTRGSTVDVSETIDAIIRSREGVYGLLSVFTLCSFLSALLYLAATFLIEGIQKTREIGIKRAVGAERRMIQREFLWKGLRIGLTALGIGVGGGALASFVLAKSEGMMFSLQPDLLLGFVVSCCACLLLASYIPARYASGITPVEALHRE